MAEATAEIQAAFDTAVQLVSAERVLEAIDRLAVRVTVALHDENPLFVCVLHGALPFTGALLQRLHFPLQLTYVHVGRYAKATRGGSLEWHARPSMDLAGRHVVLVDDVLDEGVTLAALRTYATQAGASAVTTAVLVDKVIPGRGSRPITADFSALTCPDRYLFGWGMDYRGYWRNLPAIYALRADHPALQSGRLVPVSDSDPHLPGGS